MTMISSFDASTSTLKSLTSIVSSAMVLQQPLNAQQNSDTTKSIVTSSSSDSTSSWPWLPVLLSVLALIVITLCIHCCCWYCCPRLNFNFSFFKRMLKISSRCLCFPCKRRQKRSSLDKLSEKNGFIPPSIHSDIIYNMFENSQYLDDDIFLTTRASSAASSRNADDIELTDLTSARKKKTIPHYSTPLRRSAKVVPTSTSLDTYVFGSRQA